MKLFELTYYKYVRDSTRFYNKYKNRESISWGKLNKTLKDIFVDMKYQGRLERDMVSVFGRNEKKAVIDLIKNSVKLSSDERARQRISYIENYMK